MRAVRPKVDNIWQIGPSCHIFGLALQTYQRRGRIEIRLVGSSFIKRSGRGSFFGNWDYTGEEKWRLKPLSKQIVSACFRYKTMNNVLQNDIVSPFFLVFYTKRAITFK